MARRTVLTSRQRSALFALPQREADLLRHYTLSDEDLQNIGARRRPSNKLGFALQLCVLRYPGRLLAPGEYRFRLRRIGCYFLVVRIGLFGLPLRSLANVKVRQHAHQRLVKRLRGERRLIRAGSVDPANAHEVLNPSVPRDRPR